MEWDQGLFFVMLWIWSSLMFGFGWVCSLLFQRMKETHRLREYRETMERFRRASPTDRLSR